MPLIHRNKALTLLEDPTEGELVEHLPAHVVPKILRHLDPATGDATKGEVQCTAVHSVVYNPWMIKVFYATLRPDGKGGAVQGTQFMHFYPGTSSMRVLAVTTDARVVMIQEHRRLRGAWVDDMHVAGGVPKGNALEAALVELAEEAGCAPTTESGYYHLGRWYMDDGQSADPLDLIVIDRVRAPERHANPAESIRGIRLVPWMEWYYSARHGHLGDIYATIFAARCDYDLEERRVVIAGDYGDILEMAKLGIEPPIRDGRPARPSSSDDE